MVAQLNSFSILGIIPIGDVIFGKGVITEVTTNDDVKEKVKQKVADTLHDAANSVTPSFPSLSDVLGIKEKIHEIANEMHTRALLTPDKMDDKIDFLNELYNHADKSVATHFMPTWFKEVIIYITAVMGEMTHNAVQTLLMWIYSMVSSIVLWTPEFLFENDWFAETTGKFSVISVGIVAIFTMIEGLKKILNMNHTPFRDILKKLPLSLGVSAATPFLFSQGVKWLNKLTHIVLNISKDEIGSNALTGVITTAGLVFEPINILMMLVFAIMFLVLCIPMTFFHAKRWFDLLVAGTLTPFAMSCYLFQNTEHYYRMWLQLIKSSALKQLVYAGFVMILGLLMFATPNPTTFSGILTKLLIMLGGLYRLAFPPSFIKNMSSGVDNTTIASMYRNLKRRTPDKESMVNFKGKVEDGLVGVSSKAGVAYRIFKKILK